jgi:hypothetical protein
MTKRHSYKVEVEREPGWWIIRVPELDIVTQAQRLTSVDRNAREAIAVWLNVAPDTFDVVSTLHPPKDVLDELDRSKAILDEAVAMQREGAAVASCAIHRLTDDLGLTLREAGTVVGLSHQRVAQLVGKSMDPRTKTPRHLGTTRRVQRGGED